MSALPGEDAGLRPEVGARPWIEPSVWLAGFAAACRRIEDLGAEADLTTPVPWCPGWTVGDVLVHLGGVHRLVRRWVTDGHRPLAAEAMPEGAVAPLWFGDGWRPLHDLLGGLDPREEVSTWCSYDSTAAFWWRRMAHETLVHALDVCDALGVGLQIDPELAVDGVDEALRLWLGTRLGPQVGGHGAILRLTVGPVAWSVGLNPTNVEVNHLPVPEWAGLETDPMTAYRWVWGRLDEDVPIGSSGDVAVLMETRRALARSMA